MRPQLQGGRKMNLQEALRLGLNLKSRLTELLQSLLEKRFS